MTHVVAVATPPRETLLGATAASVVKFAGSGGVTGAVVVGATAVVVGAGAVVGVGVGGGDESASHPLPLAGGGGPVNHPATSTIR